MQTYGSYQTVQDLNRTGMSCVSSAQPAGADGEPRFAVKAIRPAVDVISEAALKSAVESFLERAETQRQAAANGKHWAPVHEAGRCDGGAYYVTGIYPRSAQKLIRGRVKLSPEALHHVVDSVLLGLKELSGSAGRSHGNLKPSNVLIGGSGPVEQSPVVLSDPASLSDTLRGGGEASDLRAVGDLIHQLVAHRPAADASTGQAESRAADWSRLGASGKPWQQFAESLLNQDPDTDPQTVDEALQRLRSMRSKQRLARRGVLVVGSVALLAVVVATGIYFFRFRQDWAALCDAHARWFGELQTVLANNEFEQRFRADEHLKTVAQLLDDAEREGLELNPSRIAGTSAPPAELRSSPPLAPGRWLGTRAAIRRIEQVQRALAPGSWPALQRWQETRQQLEAQGLIGPASYLANILQDVDLSREQPHLGRGIRALLYLDSEDGKAAFAATRSLAEQLASDRAAIESAGVPPLNGFGEYTRRRLEQVVAAGADSPQYGLPRLTAELRDLADLSRQVAQVVQGRWKDQTDRERYLAEHPPQQPYSDQTYRDWIAATADYRLSPEVGQQALAELDRLAAQVKKNIETLELAPEPAAKQAAADGRKALEALAARIEALRQRRWIIKDGREDVIAAEREALARLSAGLSETIVSVATSAEEWVKRIQEVTAEHLPVQQALRELAAKTAQELRASPARYGELRQRWDKWQEAMKALDTRLPPPPRIEPPFDVAARRRWDDVMAQAVKLVGGSEAEPALDLPKIDERIAALDQWLAELKRLAADTARTVEALDAGFGLDESPDQQPPPGRWSQAWAVSPLLEEPAVAEAVKPLRERLEALRAVPSWDRSRLSASVADAATRPEVLVASLRQLLTGAQPATLAQFNEETQLRKTLDDLLLRAAKAAARREALKQELSAPAPRRWNDFLNAFADADKLAEAMQAAVAAAPLFGVSDLDGLAPHVRFNLRLDALRREVAGMQPQTSRQQVLQVVREFVTQVRELPPALAGQPGAAGLLRALEAYEKTADPTGPAAPWTLDAQTPNLLRYVWKLDAATVRTIEFIRLAPQGARPFFLATTETPLELVIDLTGPGRAPALLDLLPPEEARSGPRGWEWSGRALRKTFYWIPQELFANAAFDLYPQRLRAERNGWALRDPEAEPSERHPMHHLPATAAEAIARQLGCRLPSPAEWRAAAQRNNETSANPADRNLRDRTWREQFEHVGRLPIGAPALRQALWPNAGAFAPAADRNGSRQQDDGFLFFRKVDSGGDAGSGSFHHLVGNVAEFVRDEQTGRYAVIGGSALSAPEVQPTEAYELGEADLRRSYSDVGFRLCFPAPVSEPERLRGILARQPYLLPPGAAASN